MFVIAVIEDKLRISPDEFDRNRSEVLIKQIKNKYYNKVLIDVGLCITFYDFVEVGEPYVYPSEGAAHQLVKFRMVVFRPTVGEIIVGRISKITKDGLQISIDFFDDIHIPASLLQSPSEFNFALNVWTWRYEGNDLNIEFGDEVRFRVRTIKFTGVTATIKGVQATITSESEEMKPKANEISSIYNSSNQSSSNIGSGSSSTHKFTNEGKSNSIDPSMLTFPKPLRRRSSSFGLSTDDEVPSPMQVIGSMNDFGLGLVDWW